jgi:hypothetical protein
MLGHADRYVGVGAHELQKLQTLNETHLTCAERLRGDRISFVCHQGTEAIVWNHALCTIKEDVERKPAPPPDGN